MFTGSLMVKMRHARITKDWITINNHLNIGEKSVPIYYHSVFKSYSTGQCQFPSKYKILCLQKKFVAFKATSIFYTCRRHDDEILIMKYSDRKEHYQYGKIFHEHQIHNHKAFPSMHRNGDHKRNKYSHGIMSVQNSVDKGVMYNIT